MVDPLIELSIVILGMNWMRAYGIDLMMDCAWWRDGIVVAWCGCERGAYGPFVGMMQSIQVMDVCNSIFTVAVSHCSVSE